MWKRLIKHLAWRYRMFRRIYWPQFWYARFLPGTVQSGPFKGMKYSHSATGSVILPKLIGTYESELHPVIESWNNNLYDLCVDVGAGEGYYAAGICFRFPQINMIAFEQSKKGRSRIQHLAHRNGVLSRIKIWGRCEPAELESALSQGVRVVLIMDVEGYEIVLLDPVAVPALLSVDFIVEVHPERIEGMEMVLQHRFEATHRLQWITQQRDKALPAEVELPRRLANKQELLVNEFRGPQCWLIGYSKENRSN